MEVEFCERLWLTQNVLQAQRRIRMSENGDPGVQSEVRNANELNFVGFCRIFSGTMKKGCNVFVLGLKWKCYELLSNRFMERTKVRPVQSGQILCQSRSPATVSLLFRGLVSPLMLVVRYLLMGRALESLESVGAGNVFGVGGISHLVLKTATLSDSLACNAKSLFSSF